MKIRVIDAHSNEANECAGILSGKIKALPEKPDFIALHHNVACDGDTLRAHISGQCSALHMASSCLGTMGQFGHQTDTYGATAFCIFDPEGDYGSAMEKFTDSPFDAARKATLRALKHAERPGEAPAVIWFSATPGDEEAALDGVHDIVGQNVPIAGGSAADNDITGNWRVGDADSGADRAIVISVLFPTTKVSVGYQNGYAPTEKSGTITKSEGRRIIEIDNRPAMDVYTEWTGNAIKGPENDDPKMILSDSALWPLGQHMSENNGVANYLLAHPSTAHSNGDIDLFAEIPSGTKITQMTGDADILAARAGRVAQQVRRAQRKGEGQEIAGALMVYCAGCMLSVRPQIDRVVSGVRNALTDAPFLGVFTFGEQGPILGHGNRHGNLMVACVVFAAD